MPARNMDSDSDSVDLVARGESLDDIKQQLLSMAAEFFGVEADIPFLKLGPVHAEPCAWHMNGSPLRFEASARVYYTPTILGAPGPTWSGEQEGVTVPARRPIGPNTDDEFDEDDDEEGDEDEYDAE